MGLELYLPLALSVLFTVLQTVVKNPERKTQYKKALLKVRNGINAAFAGDPDFEPVPSAIEKLASVERAAIVPKMPPAYLEAVTHAPHVAAVGNSDAVPDHLR